jgi:hypothetical protein
MNLLTDKLRSQLPALYTQEEIYDPIVYAKFFLPDSGWTWYAIQGQVEAGTFMFFGYIFCEAIGWGYFTLRELESIRGPQGEEVERDPDFRPAPWSKIKAQHLESYGVKSSILT